MKQALRTGSCCGFIRLLEHVGHGVLAEHEEQDRLMLLIDDLNRTGQIDGLGSFEEWDRRMV